MNAATACAHLVVDQLIGLGVTDVVLAPGSRSAPLALALHQADRAGRVRLHVRVDERGAGFLALGLAKASGRCVPVVTTSGTAAANLHPAALEAWHSGVPVLLVTANRPVALHDTGANQTTGQHDLFGFRLRARAELDASTATRATLSAWRHQVTRVVTAALGIRSGAPGPAHLDIAFAEPLVPDPDRGVAASELAPPVVTRVQPVGRSAAPTRLPSGPRTVIVAGDAPPSVGVATLELARRARIPLLAEPSSNARGGIEAITGYRLLLGGPLADEIQRVIMLGHPTLSRPVLRLLGRPDVELVVVAGGAEWVDPAVNAALVTDAVDPDPDDGVWLGRWRAADQTLRGRIERLTGGDRLTGPAVAERLWQSLGDGDVLVVGSSNPIRDLDLAGTNPQPPPVYANRGLAGIDGTLSTAIGIALGSGRPTHALVGDLTFLHDLTALAIGPSEPRPALRIVVANDDGGSIFATLEQGAESFAGAFERVFGTPHGADLGALCAGFGVRFTRVGDAAGLAAAVATPPTGLEVVEVPLDRAGRRELDLALRAAAADLA